MSEMYRVLNQVEQRQADATAVIEGETRWTYSDLLGRVNKAAAGLKQQGIKAGDHVGLLLQNQKEFFVAFFALRKLGAIVVPINIQILPQDIAYVVKHAGITSAIIDESLYANFKSIPLRYFIVGETQDSHMSFDELLQAGEVGQNEPVDQSDDNALAFLMYTSGTTGNPKGVMLSEKNLLSDFEGFNQYAGINNEDRIVMALPLYHTFGLIVALAGLFSGASISLIPKFNPKRIMKSAIDEKATILPLVPTLFSILLELAKRQGGLELPSLKFCISGGAALPVILHNKIVELLKAPVLEGYGLTETSPVLTVNTPEESLPGCVGRPLPNVTIQITAKDGSVCATDQVGEVWAKGDMVMAGYYKQPEETAKILTADGWFKTGDLGHLDSEGRLFISGGRIKDLIIKAGENISPVSIEEVLHRHPAIREAAVIGLPHEKLGEEVVACVGLKEDAPATTGQDILRYCRENLAPLLIPGQVEILDQLPKGPTGKILKKVLKEQLGKRVNCG